MIMEKQANEMQFAAKQVNLREKFNSLPKVQQEACVNYFNSYNLAAWLYNEILDQDSKDYVDESVKYAKELAELEQVQSKVVDDHSQEQAILNLNGNDNLQL